ncbi:MAG: acyl carrier protein [Mycoplasma sp.]|nr:acyl carrier protein [Mycoplasma sp.]
MKYKNEVFKIIKSKTSKSFDENTVIRDLGLDSIDMVEMIADFEDNFNIQIPTEKINGVKTIKDLLNVLEEVSN